MPVLNGEERDWRFSGKRTFRLVLVADFSISRGSLREKNYYRFSLRYSGIVS